jgi:hypothetical protein
VFESVSLTPVVGASHEANKIINTKAYFFIIIFLLISKIKKPL